MGTLNLNGVTGLLEEVERVAVEVPEFGPDMTVNVRPLSAYEFRKLARISVDWSQVDKKVLNEGGYEAGELPRNPDFDEALVVTAWCSLDDKGRLVFGSNPGDAERRVAGLSLQYRAAIARIHLAVLRISGLAKTAVAVGNGGAPDDETVVVMGEGGAIEEAEKN